MPLEDCRRILDAGCGTGVLAVALAATVPGASVDAVDRDALAVAFAAHNARLNGIERLAARGSLILDLPARPSYELAVSNLPAKAGPPVLEAMVGRLASLTAGRGAAAVVVVKQLASLVERAIEAHAARVVHREQGGQHTVFHYSREAPGALEGEGAWLAPFLRRAGPFEAAGVRYLMNTAYGLPGFDTLGYDEQLVLETMDRPPEGRWMFWGPGQGHIPVALITRARGTAGRVILGARDLLALEVARLNVAASGAQRGEPVTVHRAFYFEVDETADFVVLRPDEDPGWRWQEDFAQRAARLVSRRGRLVVCGPSGGLARLADPSPWFRPLRERRRHGYCVLDWARTDEPPPEAEAGGGVRA